MKEIKKIVLTGGPCGGKTTAMNKLVQALENKGFKTIVVPETATQLFVSGFDISENGVNIVDFQTLLMRHQMNVENLYQSYAEKSNHEKVVILFDRGLLDGKAYCSKEDFVKVCENNNTNPTKLRNRYDAVIHLVSSALGAKEYYTLENNESRFETVEEAVTSDNNTSMAWVGHPNFKVVDNSVNFDDKIKTVLNEVFSVLGMPSVSKNRKFKVSLESFLKYKDSCKYRVFNIEQFYLESSLEELRLRKKEDRGVEKFYKTVKERFQKGIISARTEALSKNEFEKLLSESKIEGLIKKQRYCFLNQDVYFEIDEFKNIDLGFVVLEYQILNNSECKIPSQLEVIEEITDVEDFFNYQLSKKARV